ncbi:protein-L-isoaspartate O-methyltransferase family protein [Nesterenkonia sphaerica]|uniref:Protein-L-isoaspartate O-methyltransferase n=1 Tax=Nesterenkonia sphaerica TaxID=1804988 RepID=A0A5R9A6C4_9MICC|nr:protein-L-isoaspartate O-methyltransferase [Nesterenkonia sphaerica]TLP74223.1 protein-L-isoaspartate O-methyltransferase [Nesterenkonia sphaerica]
MRRKHRADVIAEAMAAVPRADFLPEEVRYLAQVDQALPIGFAQTNSQPRTVKAMLRLLEVQPGQKVLDVGAGSGWSTSLLAHLVGRHGQVIGVELVPELTQGAAAAVAAHRMPWAEVRQATPGQLGLPQEAPFHRILVSAEAQELPQALVDQLEVGGIMVTPVRGQLLRVVKDAEDITVTRHGPYTFVPLR